MPLTTSNVLLNCLMVLQLSARHLHFHVKQPDSFSLGCLPGTDTHLVTQLELPKLFNTKLSE